eukprot:NODE_59_length_1871_cov_563.196101_g58_i0.p1 GENE.NODE_59_length_1871_cov_563.196101_g58_i0~~NODE_59_length_1871_cov_563.196101_g58_i0.p1  ORF type:complete len:594 (-),score=185.08 NODE_59_length_1871_cov_563.196101_g58_i0:89-1816(-)
MATLDADVVHVATQLLSDSSSGGRGIKDLIIITDGYGSCGIQLASALRTAEQSGIRVLGLGVGFDTTFVEQCYASFIHAALPCALPEAFAAMEQADPNASTDTAPEWQQPPIDPDAAKDPEAVFKTDVKAFEEQLKELQQQRELQLEVGSGEGGGALFTCDVVFVIDISGSMNPWLNAVKSQMVGLTTSIIPQLKKNNPDIKIGFRFGVLGFRDSTSATPFMTKALTPMSEEQLQQSDNELVKFIKKLEASGGDDIPEDVMEALCEVTTWEWTGRARVVILITDAPGHGSALVPTGMKDDKPTPHEWLQPDVIMNQFVDAKLDFMFVRVTPQTQKMEKVFQQYYNAIGDSEQDGTRHIEIVDLVESNTVSKAQTLYHFIFVLDESGSMDGAPWHACIAAYRTFLQQRAADQGGEDIVSVITFDNTARIQCQHASIFTVTQNLEYKGGGTRYAPALGLVQRVIGKPGYQPVIIFMSDGCPGDASAGRTAMQQLYNTCKPKLYTIGFGNEDYFGTLKDLANMCGVDGQFVTAVDCVQLINTFKEIAQGCNSITTHMVQKFADKIANQLTTRLLMDHF